MSLQSLMETLRQLVANPTSNIVASSLALAAVVVFVLVIAVIVMLFIIRPPGSRARDAQAPAEMGVDPAGQPAGESGPLSALRRRRGVVVFALCAFALVAAYVSSSSGSYCAGACHSMQDAADSWRASTHASVACVRCHETSPVDGAFTRVRHAVVAITRHDRLTVRVRVSSLRCLSCHQVVLSGTRTSKDGIKVEHAHIVAAGMECLDCHAGAGHGRAKPGTGVMTQCLRCHDGNQALDACFVCHEGDPSKAAIANRTYGTVTLPPPRCDGCHAAP